MKLVEGNNQNLKFRIDSLLQVFSSLPSGNEIMRALLYMLLMVWSTSLLLSKSMKKFMFNRKTPALVLKSGAVVSQAFLVLGLSPDAKVINFVCSICFCLAELKCPHTKFHVNPFPLPHALGACSCPNFFMEKISNTECKKKKGQCLLCPGRQMGKQVSNLYLSMVVQIHQAQNTKI